MFLTKNTAVLKAHLASSSGQSIGFVPTMGALHAGHISLIEKSLKENDITVCSIFVNPTQFNQAADLEKYPRTLEADITLLEKTGCHVLFHPEIAEMYPEGTAVNMRDLGLITQVFEGVFRVGHFDGVCEIVNRFFQIIQPTKAYFGLKDYQQCMVINAMVKSESIPVELVFSPTQRDANELALSSRNRRLDEAQYKDALIIPQTLQYVKENYGKQTTETLLNEARQRISSKTKVDYLDIVHAETLQPITSLNEPAVALFAGWVGDVRLIDNTLLMG